MKLGKFYPRELLGSNAADRSVPSEIGEVQLSHAEGSATLNTHFGM